MFSKLERPVEVLRSEERTERPSLVKFLSPTSTLRPLEVAFSSFLRPRSSMSKLGLSLRSLKCLDGE